jgi:L-ascorbate 6-phosphate lactonase
MHLIEHMDSLEVIPNALGLYFFGQVGVTIRGPDGVLYIDPYLTDFDWGSGGTLPRLFPSPLEPERVTNASGVLVTHEHPDHFDPTSLEPISRQSPDAVFVGPYPCDFARCGIASQRVVRPRVLEPFQLGSAIITALPSAHDNLGINDGEFAHFGYIVQWNGVTVYHAGDTIIWDAKNPELRQLEASHRAREGLLELLRGWRIDVAFLPINGRDYFRENVYHLVGNLDVREVVEMAQRLDIGVVVPTHYDLFARNLEAPGRFVDELYAANPMRRSKVMRPGELYYFVRQDT